MNPFPKFELWPWMLVAFVLTLLVFAKPVHTVTNVIIDKRFDDYFYRFCPESGEKCFDRHITRDYESPASDFLEGKVFTDINFVEMGNSWSLNPDNQASYHERKGRVLGNCVYKTSKGEKELPCRMNNPLNR